MRTVLFCSFAVIALAITGCATRSESNYPYDEPLASPGVKLSGVPPAVQSTIRSQVGTEEIVDIVKLSELEEEVYKVMFRDPRLFPPLYVRSDGSVLYPNMQVAVSVGDTIGALSGGSVSGVKFGDLPVRVANGILEKAPTAEIGYITQIMVGDQTFYEVTFKNERNPKLVVTEEGTVIEKLPDPNDVIVIPFSPRSPDSPTAR